MSFAPPVSIIKRSIWNTATTRCATHMRALVMTVARITTVSLSVYVFVRDKGHVCNTTETLPHIARRMRHGICCIQLIEPLLSGVLVFMALLIVSRGIIKV